MTKTPRRSKIKIPHKLPSQIQSHKITTHALTTMSGDSPLITIQLTLIWREVTLVVNAARTGEEDKMSCSESLTIRRFLCSVLYASEGMPETHD